MNFIEHIIEPTKLLLAWQSFDEQHRTRHIVGELIYTDSDYNLKYNVSTQDFKVAQQNGFVAYPAFPDVIHIYSNALDAFMRRLPPRTRGDFPQYLQSLRIKPDAQLSDFALLGYSGAKLPSDGFSFIHPFENVDGHCELLLEVAGFRHISKKNKIEIDQLASFSIEANNEFTHEDAVQISVSGEKIGYVNRGLVPTFINWIQSTRIAGAWIEKLNGTPERPSAYLYVKVNPK